MFSFFSMVVLVARFMFVELAMLVRLTRKGFRVTSRRGAESLRGC
jgi:hypothetical protein